MKNSFFVFFELVFGLVFLFLIGISSFLWFAIDAFYEDIGLSIILTVMLVVGPTFLLIWDIFNMLPKIELTEQGINKSLFGIKIKSFKWEDIKYIYPKGNYNQWIFISKKDLSKKSLAKNRLSKDCIYFFKSAKKMVILEHYLPEYLKEQVKI